MVAPQTHASSKGLFQTTSRTGKRSSLCQSHGLPQVTQEICDRRLLPALPQANSRSAAQLARENIVLILSNHLQSCSILKGTIFAIRRRETYDGRSHTQRPVFPIISFLSRSLQILTADISLPALFLPAFVTNRTAILLPDANPFPRCQFG